MGRKRKKEELPEITENEALVPFDALKFHTKDDPCYGKLYDLMADECRRCGASEHCLIAFSQNGHGIRAAQGGEETFLDIEEGNKQSKEQVIDTKAIKKFYRKKKRDGLSRKEAILAASEKFKLDKKQIRKVIPKVKKK